MLHHVASHEELRCSCMNLEYRGRIEPEAANSAEAMPLTGARVLFLDHTAAMSGGEIALFNLLRFLDPEKVTPVVVLGAEGSAGGKITRHR